MSKINGNQTSDSDWQFSRIRVETVFSSHETIMKKRRIRSSKNQNKFYISSPLQIGSYMFCQSDHFYIECKSVGMAPPVTDIFTF